MEQDKGPDSQMKGVDPEEGAERRELDDGGTGRWLSEESWKRGRGHGSNG